MYNTKDLFNQRSVFSAKLEQIINSQSITKAKLCKEAGISRPTLDKLLSAEITNETNFEKHVTKILKILHLTPDAIMGNTHHAYNKMRQIKKALHISDESISTATGISLAKLEEIEAGANASLAELRDIALCCRTSVRGLLGTNHFDIPISEHTYFIENGSFERPHGFWGHIGILPAFGDEYLWFPISSNVRDHVYNTLGQHFLVIPCMNNKLLFLNKDGINNIVMLDDDCDQPDFTNWDPSVSVGELPLVVFEVLRDYQYEDMPDDTLISPKFQELLSNLIKEKQWTETDISQILDNVTIYFKNSPSLSVIADFYADQTLTSAVQFVYDFGELQDKIIYFNQLSGAEIIINLDNISLMELPLLAVEDEICREFEEMMEFAEED